ncbi:MAG: hypothetical protein HKN43_06080 [Rhodothermales bacterium]|nr:hypothetical protein [Rhodothermales bacterium]
MIPNFRPGMSGTVDVSTMTVENVVAIPIQAVSVRDLNQVARDQAEKARRTVGSADSTVSVDDIPEEEDLQRVVFVVVDGMADMRTVETGISDDTHIEIKNGISAGESVIIGPYRAVSRTLEPDASVNEDSDDRNPSDD